MTGTAAAAVMIAALAALAGTAAGDDHHHPQDRGTCIMYVHGTILYDHTDDLGNPRHNPDHTLYPNDMASFRFTYSFGENCINPYVGRVQDEPGDAILMTGSWGLQDEHVAPGSSGSIPGDLLVIPGAANACHGAPPEGGGGPDGYSSDFGVPRDCGDVSLTISAYTWVCIPDVGCYKVRIRDTARVAPPVVAPIVTVNTTRHMLLDPDGYPAANLDLTHYPWDPIAIEPGSSLNTGMAEAAPSPSGTTAPTPAWPRRAASPATGPAPGISSLPGIPPGPASSRTRDPTATAAASTRIRPPPGMAWAAGPSPIRSPSRTWASPSTPTATTPRRWWSGMIPSLDITRIPSWPTATGAPTTTARGWPSGTRGPSGPGRAMTAFSTRTAAPRSPTSTRSRLPAPPLS